MSRPGKSAPRMQGDCRPTISDGIRTATTARWTRQHATEANELCYWHVPPVHDLLGSEHTTALQTVWLAVGVHCWHESLGLAAPAA